MVTAAGDPYCWLKGWAYLMRTEKNADLITEIEGGIKKETRRNEEKWGGTLRREGDSCRRLHAGYILPYINENRALRGASLPFRKR